MENHLRAHRRRCGLTQRDLAELVGYLREGQISRHECAQATPPLAIALAYEAVLEIPMSKLFPRLHKTVTEGVGRRIAHMRQELQRHKGPNTKAARRKLQWLNQHQAG